MTTSARSSGTGRSPGTPGTPSLLREMNVRAALALLLDHGPLSRADLGRLSGLSKVTASQLLSHLSDLGLVEVAGTRAGNRGPTANVYGVVATAAYVVGVDVGPTAITASACDLLGAEGPRIRIEVGPTRPDPVALVQDAVHQALTAAAAAPDRLRAVTIGLPGLVDPATGDVEFSFDLPDWSVGLRARLEDAVGAPVAVENDMNLVAVAEHRIGAAVGVDDFVLLWVGRGIGSAIVLSGEVHRGASGAAGELGYLPVPGVELPRHISRRDKGAFQRVAGEEALLAAAAERGVEVARIEQAIAEPHLDPALVDDIAWRLAVGVAALCAVVDPGLVVLAGPLAGPGAADLCERVAAAVATIAPVHPKVVPTTLPDAPVLRGAHLTALDAARAALAAA